MSDERDIELVLVTGAGASCRFGNGRNGGSSTLPLMPEWSNILVDNLNKSSHGVTQMVGLEKDLEGPEFERRLGQFLAMAEFFPDVEQLVEPSAYFPSVSGSINVQQIKDWHIAVGHQINLAVEVIHRSMFENFGWDRCNPDGAIAAYGQLLAALNVGRLSKMVYATTNYDLIGEGVFDRLERRPEYGLRQAFGGPGVSSQVRLDVENLVDTVGRNTPILHLHGAVGWFDTPGFGPTLVGNSAFDSSWGTPIAMLPSLDKDYQQNSTISAIWVEFRKALRRAKKVLVLGHSLNDVELARALIDEVQPLQRIGMTHLPGSVFEPPESIRPMWADYERVPHFAIDFNEAFGGDAGLTKWAAEIEGLGRD